MTVNSTATLYMTKKSVECQIYVMDICLSGKCHSEISLYIR